jgi:ubiquinone/menaquinone biosynthesis C-methylase UbiE
VGPLPRLVDRAFAAVYDRVLAGVERAGLAATRTDLLASAHGRVVEVGAGTGANLAAYPSGLDHLTLVEPSPAMRRRLADRVATLADRLPAVTVLDGRAETLPLADASADTAVVTLVLCSVEDPDRAAAELHRMLAPGGTLLVVEHVAGHGATARLQRRLDPVWRRVTRGCRLTRDTRTTLARAGFDVRGLADAALPGGGPTGPAIVGVARRPA